MLSFKFKKGLENYDYFFEVHTSDINANERFKEKLDFLALSQIRRESVSSLDTIYKDNRNYILDNFYGRLLEIPDFSHIIHSHSTVERLKNTFDRHFMSLFQDELNLDYVYKRRQIAHTHARIGVLPNWMISAYTLLNQLFIPLIVKKFKRDTPKMLDVLLSYNSLITIDQQIVVETYIEIQGGSVVNGLGEIIEYNTQLDQIKELLEFQETQKQDVLQAADLMLELDASIEEVATSVEDIVNHTQNSLEELNKDLSALEHVATILQNTDQGQQQVQQDVTHLVKRVTSVAHLMELIKGIADQTNLLALNASIEAARAGEAGKGFSIVAEEVRKLADVTKNSVESIHTDIHELLQITTNIDKLTKQATHELHTGVVDATNITKTLAELNETMQVQGARFEEMAHATRSQAKSASEISARNKSISNSAIQSKEITFNTGSAIYQLSKMIDTYRLNTVSKNMIIGQEDVIRLMITDHLLWRWKVYNLLLGFENMTEQDIEPPHETRLGKWYYGQGKKLLGNEPVFKELEQPHMKVHEIAIKAIKAYNNGDKVSAEKYLDELSHISQVVVDKLQQLQAIILKSKKPQK